MASTGSHRTTEAPDSQRSRSIRRAVARGLVTLVIAAGLAWAWHWRTHPSVFASDGNQATAPLPAGEELVALGVTFPDPGEGEAVSIRSVAPRVVQNSAGATFEFFVCTQDSETWDQTALGLVYGASRFAEFCPDPRPVEPGTDLDTGATEPQQLVMVVTVTKPGVVATHGVDLTYSHGWQRGTQSTGVHLRVKSQ